MPAGRNVGEKKTKPRRSLDKNARNHGVAFQLVADDDALALSALMDEWPQWVSASCANWKGLPETFSLLMAAIPASPRCARLLIERAPSAMPPHWSDFDQAPILLAMEAGRLDWFERLIPKTDLRAATYTGRTVLTRAATIKDPQFVAALARAGQNMSERDAKGTSPLEMASANAAPLTVRALLNLGADPSDLNEAGHDAMMRSARNGAIECVRELMPFSDLTRRAIPLGAKSRKMKNAFGIAVGEPQDKRAGIASRWEIADLLAVEMLRRGARKAERDEIDEAIGFAPEGEMAAARAWIEGQKIAIAARLGAGCRKPRPSAVAADENPAGVDNEKREGAGAGARAAAKRGPRRM